MTNQIKTILLMGALTALVIAIGALVAPGQLYLFAAIALAMNLGAYFFSDRVVLRLHHARELNVADAPELHAIVDELASRAQIPKPRVYLIPEQQPNAFATGRNPGRGVVAVTEGLLASGGGAGTAGRGHGRLSRSVLARPSSSSPRPPPPEEPWVSRKDWRRALAIAIERRLTRAELRELLARLARVRRGAEPPPASPRLQLVRGGKRGPAGPPFPGAGPVSKEAA